MKAPGHPINLHHREAVRSRRPLLIAHRGGVVTRQSPENSLAAIRLAADRYDLVELDIVIASDDEPVLFHGAGHRRTLRGTSGGDTPVSAYTSTELAAMHYDGTDQQIAMLDDALALCTSHGLGVMLDFKLSEGEDLTRPGVERVADLLDRHGLTSSTMTITPYPVVLNILPPEVLVPVSDADLDAIAAGGTPTLGHAFWFGIPKHLDEAMIGPLREAGALVIPAINRFRYPADDHESPARADILRLLAKGVDGFQLDSPYLSLIPPGA